MNKQLAILLSPNIAALLGLLALTLPAAPALPLATLFLAAGSLATTALGLYANAIPIRRNRLEGRLAIGLLATFNLLATISIVIAVLALLTLLGFLAPAVNRGLIAGIWILAVLLVSVQAAVVVERRINTPRPEPSRPILALLLGLTSINVLLWTNALLIDHTSFLFVTGLHLAPSQAVYLLLTGITLQSVAAMVLLRIPTVIELVFARRLATGRILALTNTSPLIFTLAFTGLVLVASLVVVLAADRLFNAGGLLPQALGLRVLLVFPIALITFLIVAGYLSYRRSRASYKHKMDGHDKTVRILAMGSTIVTLALLFLAWTLSQGAMVQIGAFPITPDKWPEALIAALLVATGPVGFYLQAHDKRIKRLEEALSELLRDLAETAKAGLPLAQGLASAAEKDYGPLTDDVRRMSIQCSWGLSFGDVFLRFAERSRSRLIRRAAYLVMETAVSGGNSADVLSAMATEIHQQKTLEHDRRSAMTTHIAVIYIVFFVFVGILAVLSYQFLPQLLSATEAANNAGASTSLFSSSRINLQAVREAYFHALLVQSFGNGFVAGIVRDASIGTGLKHTFILVTISYVAFRFMFG